MVGGGRRLKVLEHFQSALKTAYLKTQEAGEFGSAMAAPQARASGQKKIPKDGQSARKKGGTGVQQPADESDWSENDWGRGDFDFEGSRGASPARDEVEAEAEEEAYEAEESEEKILREIEARR